MHRSIPAMPIPPPLRATARHLLTFSYPRGGGLEISPRPGGLGICVPRDDPRAFDTSYVESA